jgi:peptidoglycan/LPS O-acetylase OafA/YrhL
MLGIISYGIYIYHLPCLTFIDRYMARFGMDAAEHWILLGVTGLSLSIAISALSFIVVEKPILRAAKKVV